MGTKLTDLESVGKATEKDLHLLGITSIDQLAKANASELYERLCEITKTRHDVCCLDVFQAAIAQARDPQLPKEQRKWWYWSKVRKAENRAAK